MGKGGHIGTLDVGGARVVVDGIGPSEFTPAMLAARTTRLHILARISMVTSMTRWPPVGGHPAMKVTIELLFRRVGEGGTRKKVGVRVARLLFRLMLAFLA
jgi:hypothetical protein